MPRSSVSLVSILLALVTLPPVGHSAADTALLQDCFESAERWTLLQGKFEARGGSLRAVSDDAAAAVAAGRRFGDVVVDLDMLRPERGFVGVSLRRQDEGAAWCDAHYFCSLRPSHFRIITKRQGHYDPALFDSSNLAELQPNRRVHLRIWLKRDHFRVWIDGRLAANVRTPEPLGPGGLGLHVGSGGTVPKAEFANLLVRDADAVPPPKPSEIPPRSLVELVDRGEEALRKQTVEIKKRLAACVREGLGARARALSDAELQDLASQVHCLLWRCYYEPRTHMVYTILEPHTGQPILPTPNEVHRGLPNLNGWSTPIEDCAGYGNGKHLAWLVERWEATRLPKHEAQARRILLGALRLGEVRPADDKGFAELLRGLLPDNATYYVGTGRGSSGDNYNGYSYGMWRCFRSPLATPEEKARIASVMRRTCYRGSTIFSAIAGDMTHDPHQQDAYKRRAEHTAQAMASCTVQSRSQAKSWTAVQLQVRLAALRVIDTDPQRRAAYDLAMRINAWSRCSDVLDGLRYDPTDDDYMHRVNTVRNPMDGMLTVMLTGNREVIDAFVPVFRRVVAGYDFRDFRDQRQLTPFLGAYWLGVRHAALVHDHARPEPPGVSLNPLDPSRDLVLTYFPNCNARAGGVRWAGPFPPCAPNWQARLSNAQIDRVDEAMQAHIGTGGEARFEAISAPWVRNVNAERGYAIAFRAQVTAGYMAVEIADGAFAGRVRLTPTAIELGVEGGLSAAHDGQWHEFRIEAKQGMAVVQIDSEVALRAELRKQAGARRLWWGTPPDGRPAHFLVSEFRFEADQPFRYPVSKR